MQQKVTSLCLLCADAGVRVGDTDAEDGGLLDDGDALAGRDVRGDLGGELAVVHEKHVDVLDVGAVADAGHGQVALETPPDTVVNTLGLAPCRRDAGAAVRLVALERLCALLDDRDLRRNHCRYKLGRKLSPM